LTASRESTKASNTAGFASVARAMASASGREQFLKQFEQIVEGVKQNRTKVSVITTFIAV